MTNEELWQAALASIQLQISRANFATWFKNTSIASQKDGEIVVSVPNGFSREWLQNKYNRLVFHAIHDLTKGIREIRYEVEKSSAPSGQPSQGVNTRSEQAAGDQQLTLADFRISKSTNLNPRYSLDNFVVGPFNELAHAASMAVIKNPGQIYNPLFIYGGVGLGKTHLLQAVGNAISSEMPDKKIRYVSSERFTSSVVAAIRNKTMEQLRSLYREIDVLVMDDVQFFAGKEKTQEELFHTFNALYEHGKQIIFSSDRPPKAIPALEERLRSRFEGGMIADVGVPDFETRLAILKTKAQELGVSPSEETLGYIASHIQRNVRELEGALNRILAFQRLNGKEPSFIEARTILRTVIQSHGRQANPQKIIRAVAEFYDIREKELIAASRKKEVVKPRQIAMYLLREELKSSYPFIGKRFGGKDHTTAMYACGKVAQELLASEFLVDEMSLIRQRIYGA